MVTSRLCNSTLRVFFFFLIFKLVVFSPNQGCLNYIISLEVIYQASCNCLWSHKRLYTTYVTYAVVLPKTCKQLWCEKMGEFPFKKVLFSVYRIGHSLIWLFYQSTDFWKEEINTNIWKTKLLIHDFAHTYILNAHLLRDVHQHKHWLVYKCYYPSAWVVLCFMSQRHVI